MKTILKVIALVLAASVLYAGVSLKSEADRKQYTFNLEPGDRIIVVKGAKTVSVSPTKAKQFDLTIPAGKRFNGMLILN